MNPVPLITHSLVAVIFTFGTWSVITDRHALAIEKLQHRDTQRALDVSNDTIRRINQLTQDTAKNADAAIELQNTLRSLRTDVISVRTDLAKRITTASRETLAEYASTCNAVFAAMAEGGERLSIAGAELARKADGHAADARR